MRSASEVCLYCEQPITQPDRGRKRSFCSGRCKTAYARQKQREAHEQAEDLKFRNKIMISGTDRRRLVSGVMPETREFILDVLEDYGLAVAQQVAQGIRIEREAQRPARKQKKATIIVDRPRAT